MLYITCFTLLFYNSSFADRRFAKYIIAAFIFRRRNLNKTNMGFFYFWICVFNAFTLLFYLFIVESDLFLNYNLSRINDVSCKVFF